MRGIKTQANPVAGTDEPLSCTVEEAADHLRVTPRYVYILIEREELDSFKIGNSRRIRKEDVKAYMDRLVEEERALRRRARSAA